MAGIFKGGVSLWILTHPQKYKPQSSVLTGEKACTLKVHLERGNQKILHLNHQVNYTNIEGLH